jgi:hypothetical protein
MDTVRNIADMFALLNVKIAQHLSRDDLKQLEILAEIPGGLRGKSGADFIRFIIGRGRYSHQNTTTLREWLVFVHRMDIAMMIDQFHTDCRINDRIGQLVSPSVNLTVNVNSGPERSLALPAPAGVASEMPLIPRSLYGMSFEKLPRIVRQYFSEIMCHENHDYCRDFAEQFGSSFSDWFVMQTPETRNASIFEITNDFIRSLTHTMGLSVGGVSDAILGPNASNTRCCYRQALLAELWFKQYFMDDAWPEMFTRVHQRSDAIPLSHLYGPRSTEANLSEEIPLPPVPSLENTPTNELGLTILCQRVFPESSSFRRPGVMKNFISVHDTALSKFVLVRDVRRLTHQPEGTALVDIMQDHPWVAYFIWLALCFGDNGRTFFPITVDLPRNDSKTLLQSTFHAAQRFIPLTTLLGVRTTDEIKKAIEYLSPVTPSTKGAGDLIVRASLLGGLIDFMNPDLCPEAEFPFAGADIIDEWIEKNNEGLPFGMRVKLDALKKTERRWAFFELFCTWTNTISPLATIRREAIFSYRTITELTCDFEQSWRVATPVFRFAEKQSVYGQAWHDELELWLSGRLKDVDLVKKIVTSVSENEVDIERLLPYFTETLVSLGVTAWGPRDKIMREIQSTFVDVVTATMEH